MRKINEVKNINSTVLEIVSCLKENRIFLRDIKFMALLGSVREKEYVFNYSDVDILLIINSDMSGAIDNKTVSFLKKTSADISKRFNVKLSLLTHTENDLFGYVEYEYLRHYSFGKVLYGPRKHFRKMFEEAISFKKPNNSELSKQMYNVIVHARFNLIRKYISLNKFNTKNYSHELIKLFIDNVLEIADWRLISDGIWASSKKEIVKKIERQSKSVFKNVVKTSYEYRKNWNKRTITKEEMEIFFANSIEFINDCVRDLGKKI